VSDGRKSGAFQQEECCG